MESPAGASPAAASATESVNVMRASGDHGTDVRSSDHRKVGDIVDFVFHVRGTPQLAYVLVTTGGFLDVGGESRAVPAGAITFNVDTARIDNIMKDEYLKNPVVRTQREGYFANEANRRNLATTFHQDPASNDRSMPATGGHRSFVSLAEMRRNTACSSAVSIQLSAESPIPEGKTKIS